MGRLNLCSDRGKTILDPAGGDPIAKVGNPSGEEKPLEPVDQGWANLSVQGSHSKIHNFIGPHSILAKIIDIKYIK